MLNDIISNYALSELLEVEGNSLAIADKDGNILWCNKSFKEDSGFAKIKGRSFYALFSLPDDGDRSTLEKKKPLKRTSSPTREPSGSSQSCPGPCSSSAGLVS